MNASNSDDKASEEGEISLTVKRAKKRDIGRYIIRIDSECMKKLGIKNFDVINVRGKKVTAGIAWPIYPEDEGLEIVRLESRLQKNAGTSIDDTVHIKKTEPKIAQNIELKPIETNLRSNPRLETFI